MRYNYDRDDDDHHHLTKSNKLTGEYVYCKTLNEKKCSVYQSYTLDS